MNWNPPETTRASRRSYLAATATALSISTAGCIDRVRSVADGERSDRLSLSILTVPADDDRESAELARHLESRLEAVGIDASVATRDAAAFLETILLERDFDLYVSRLPTARDPDFLYPALHSGFANEAGWQNPFSFASMTFDSLLEAQRAADGDERFDAVEAVLEAFLEEKPFEPICRPAAHRLVRTDRIDGWTADRPWTRTAYLGLEPADGVDELHALVTDSRPSRSVNPVSATNRECELVVELLYDSLATADADGELRPWLAADWEWDGDELVVDLREDCRFHDGEVVDAADVAFTYRFLADTTLGRASADSPAPRYRGRISTIDDVAVADDRRVRLTAAAGRDAAERALTVPILPAHVWREGVENRLEDESSPPRGRWSLLTDGDVSPVGSGPYRLADRSEREHVTLERFEDHFTLREDVDLPEPTVETVRFGVDPGSRSSIERVASGDADATATRLSTHALEDVPDDGALERLDPPSPTVYHVGYNTRKAPMSNPRFRRAVGRLIDEAEIAEEVFRGRGEPLSVLVAEEWTPDDLAYDGDDPATPFLGDDGDLDVDAAVEAFEDAGYRYVDGRLLG